MLSFLTYFDRVCIMQAQQDIQLDLNLTDQQMGLVLSAFWFAYGLFEIPSGWFGDRFGTRSTLTRIVIGWSLFTGLSGAANGFALLLIFRFLFGAGEAGAYPNMAKVQQTWLPLKTRGRTSGLLWLCARWGGAFSPLIFSSILIPFRSTWFHNLFPNIAPWRIGFFASALVGFIWVAFFYWWFRNTPAEKPTVSQAELDLIEADRPPEEQISTLTPITPNAPTSIKQSIWPQMFACPSLWAFGILYLCGSFGWNFFVSWMPKFFLEVHHIKYDSSAYFSGLPLLFGGISCLVGGTLSDLVVKRTGSKRWGRAVFPITGCIVAAIAIFCVGLTTTPAAATILMCITAAAYDFGQGANWAALINIGGRYAGTSTGFMNTIGNMGNSLQSVIGAWMFSNCGWSALFALYALMYLIAGSMWLIIDPRKTFYREEVTPVST